MTEDEDKYEQPTITQIVHALIIYGLVKLKALCNQTKYAIDDFLNDQAER